MLGAYIGVTPGSDCVWLSTSRPKESTAASATQPVETVAPTAARKAASARLKGTTRQPHSQPVPVVCGAQRFMRWCHRDET